jgi:hypothetical protein
MRQSTNETMAPRAGESLAKNINSLECLTGAKVASEPKGLFGTLPNRTGASTPQARSPAADQDHGASQEDRLGGPIEQINTQATKNHQHNISGIVLDQGGGSLSPRCGNRLIVGASTRGSAGEASARSHAQRRRLAVQPARAPC